MAAASTGVFQRPTENAEISFGCWPLISVCADWTCMKWSVLQNFAERSGDKGQRPSVCCRHTHTHIQTHCARRTSCSFGSSFEKINYSSEKIKVQSERFHYNSPSVWVFSHTVASFITRDEMHRGCIQRQMRKLETE